VVSISITDYPEIVKFASLAVVRSIALKASPYNYVQTSTTPTFVDVQTATNYTPGRDGLCAIILGNHIQVHLIH